MCLMSATSGSLSINLVMKTADAVNGIHLTSLSKPLKASALRAVKSNCHNSHNNNNMWQIVVEVPQDSAPKFKLINF